jgi:hypothetical protein
LTSKEKIMSKKFITMALAAALAAGTAIPAAQAGGRDHRHDGRHSYNGDHHRGNGHWRNGKWIVLGLAAAAAASAANNDCYYRHGRRYCR